MATSIETDWEIVEGENKNDTCDICTNEVEEDIVLVHKLESPINTFVQEKAIPICNNIIDFSKSIYNITKWINWVAHQIESLFGVNIRKYIFYICLCIYILVILSYRYIIQYISGYF
jgi:hypothetical protein